MFVESGGELSPTATLANRWLQGRGRSGLIERSFLLDFSYFKCVCCRRDLTSTSCFLLSEHFLIEDCCSHVSALTNGAGGVAQ